MVRFCIKIHFSAIISPYSKKLQLKSTITSIGILKFGSSYNLKLQVCVLVIFIGNIGNITVIGSILLNRTLKKFLDCQDLTGEKGVALTKKIRDSATKSLEIILKVIPTADKQHSDVLKKICLEHAKGANKELLLNNLGSDATSIRATAVDILSQSTDISNKLFQRLHQTDASKAEIIKLLSFQKQFLAPQQIINNALKLNEYDAQQLLALAEHSELPLDFDHLYLEPSQIESPAIKISLLRYFGKLKQPEASQIISKFLADQSKTVVFEALKSLQALAVSFDASVVLPFINTMSESEQDMALKVVINQANPTIVPNLAPWAAGKSDDVRLVLIKLVAKHVTKEGLKRFLQQLDLEDWVGKDRAVKCLLRVDNDGLYNAAQALVDDKQEFIRGIAQQLVAKQGDPADLKKIGDSALHENWQVREKAIVAIGNSGNRQSLPLLTKVIKQWPESTVGVLKAINKLGFSKGLEIAFTCLKMPEAAIQREALITISNLTAEKNAATVRDTVLIMVPKLQATVRDTAEQVLMQLTKDYSLSELQVDKKLFETRLIKIDQHQKKTVDHEQLAPTEIITFNNIDELKLKSLWLDRYRITKEIGRGAMGKVMLAEDEMVGESLVLKFMLPELTADGASRERFLREVKYSRKVSHPNVIRIHDMLFKDNLCAISMEYFVSRGIDEVLKKVKIFEAEEGLKILYQVAAGMSAAHDQEIIHRDLKPSNILINDEGLVKVVDFGIASASTNTEATLTRVGSIIGTPPYLSPERAKGQDAHYSCDIYALGIIAYYMFTGRLPYTGEPMAILFQHLEGNAPPIHEVRKSIPVPLSFFVQKLMATKAENRVQTMAAVCTGIQEVQDKLKN